MQEILEDAEISTEVLLQKLDKVGELTDEIFAIKNKIKKELHTYSFVIEKEKQAQLAADEANETPEQLELIQKTKEHAEKRFKDYKQDIKNKIRRDYELTMEKKEG